MGRETYFWLRTVALGGAYPLPTSEATYQANSRLCNAVIPTTGYKMQSDGTWTRDAAYDNAWTQSLPNTARNSGQQYTPSVDTTQAALHTVLDDEGLWDTAISNLLTLSSGWDAVVYDAIDSSQDRVDAHGNFVLEMSAAVRQEGIPFHLSYYGVTWDNPACFPLSVAAQAADVLIYYCYAWWAQPKMVSPYYYVRNSLDFALSQNVPRNRIVLGAALYSTWWPVEGEATRHDMTYNQAITIVNNNNAIIEWMENSAYGLVRERYADTGAGYAAITDGDTLRHKLDIIDEYGLKGLMLFTPGLESEGVWDTVSVWQNKVRQKQTAQKLYGTGGLFNHG